MKNISIIELYLDREEKFSISCCKLIYNKKKFLMKEFCTQIQSFDELPKYLINSTTYLSIHGKGIISKNLSQTSELTEKLSNDNTFSQYFDFNEIHFLSMIHRDILSKYLDLFYENRINIKKIFIGALPLLQITDLNTNKEEYSLYGYTFVLINDNQYKIISSPNSSKEEIIYKNIRYSSDQIMLLAITDYVTSLSNQKIIYKDNFDDVLNLKSRFYFSRYYKLIQRVAVFALFILLISNFLIYMSLSNKNLSGEMNISQLKKLTAKEDSLRILLKKQNTDNREQSNLYLSLYCDRVFSTLPEGIKFNEFIINPSRFQKDQKLYHFENNKINLNGIAENSYILNQWLKLLENKSLITKSNVIGYKQESGLSNGNFNIELICNEDWMNYLIK